jgi:FkbM family methyltransferase
MKILISSLCPFIISGYSNQINLLITYLHKFNPDIEIGIICWNNWPIPFKTISYDLNFIINNLSFKISDEQKNIYKNVKFYSPGELNNHWHKIKLFSNDFNANKILVYQDIWIFEKFDIASINVDKYLWLPIHNDFREHKLLGFKDNFNSEINTLFQLPFFKKISTFSKFGVEVLKTYKYQSTFINHMIPDDIFNVKHDKLTLRKKYNYNENDFICLIVARNSESSDRKAYVEQLNAFALFSKDKDNTFLLIHENHKHSLTEGAVNLYDICKKLDILDKIKLTQKTSYSQDHVVELFYLADVLLCASKSEGFGLPMVEAQFCNLLVITNNCTSMPDNTYNGICVEPENITTTINGINSWSNPSPINISNALNDIYNKNLDKYNIKPINKNLYNPEILIDKWVDFLELDFFKNNYIYCHILNDNIKKTIEIINNYKNYKYLILINPKYNSLKQHTNYLNNINIDPNIMNNILIIDVTPCEFFDEKYFFNYLSTDFYFSSKINIALKHLIKNNKINNNDTLYIEKLSYKLSIEKYLQIGIINVQRKKYGDFIFNNHILKFFNVLNKLPIRNIKNIKECKYNAVLIETRNSPLIEPILLNTIYFTDDDIGFQIYFHQNNKNLIYNIINKYNLKNIELTEINYKLQNNIEYSQFLFSKEFYDTINSDNILIYQIDSLLLKKLDNKYFKYDWIGALWNKVTLTQNEEMKKIFNNLLPIGNGGFNIRNIKKCKEIAQKFDFKIPLIENKLLMEDNVYSVLLQNFSTAVFPSIQEAADFSVETIANNDPTAIHAFYKYFNNTSYEINYIENTLERHYLILKNNLFNYNNKEDYFIYDNQIIDQKINFLHKKLKLNHGTFNEELPEQKIIIRFLTGNEKVLEIGSNIGRSSLIISHILNNNDNNNFVTLESDEESYNKLIENKEINDLDFYTENFALSKRNLIQNKWNTYPSDTIIEGFKKINTINLSDLYNKYNIDFDTLILDCEGAFYYILLDMPEILNNIKLIIMENDYNDINHKKYVDDILIKNNFNIIYKENLISPLIENFYEVWKKIL